MRLFTRKTVKETDDELKELLAVILKIMKENTQTIMPGFTHLQRLDRSHSHITWEHILRCLSVTDSVYVTFIRE